VRFGLGLIYRIKFLRIRILKTILKVFNTAADRGQALESVDVQCIL